MIIFLLVMCTLGIAITLGLIWYQKKNIRIHTDEKGDFIERDENPLSLKNIHTSRAKVQLFIKEEIKYLIVGILRLLIKLKRVSRKMIDRGITKLAHLAFPEEKLNGPIDENTLLSHVEDHKKTADSGRIE